MLQPLLSVVTILKDSDPLVFKTAESLLPQLGPRIEWVIKNSDERCTPELLNLTKRSKYIKLYSVPDKSSYDGLNQSLKLITGARYSFMGAGDTFEENAVSEIIAAIECATTNAAIFFPIWYDDPPTGIIVPKPMELPLRMAIPYPGAILDTQTVISLGGYNMSYQIAADYDLVCRYIKEFPESHVYETPICRFMPGGMSEQRRSEGFFEKQLVRVRVWGYKPDFIK